jgi:acyl carrier protein
MGISFNREELIAEVVRRITLMQKLGLDPLDTIEFVTELQEEFGIRVVHQAISLLEMQKKCDRSRPKGGEPDPMWDRELDG